MSDLDWDDDKFGYLLGIFMITLVLAFFVFAVWAIQKAHAQPEKAPASQRSLEVIDHLGWGVDEPDIYLIRVRSCYYITRGTGDDRRMIHLLDCPNPVHQSKK